MDLISKTRQTIQAHQLLAYGDRILVAVSGGPDSMALLNVLCELRQEFALSLVAAHVNHGLRLQSLSEERLVQKSCHNRFLPFVSCRIHFTKKERTSSLENAARKKRYAALSQMAQRHHCSIIAVAHHQDDLAETVLMHVLRGTGMLGLQGFLPQRELGRCRLIRPFYSTTHNEIMRFLTLRKIPFCLDASNRNIKFFRNRIRLKLLPVLHDQYQNNISSLLASLAENMAVDYDFLKQRGEEFLSKVLLEKPSRSRFRLNLMKLQKSHPCLQRMVIRLVLERLQNNLLRMTYAHWKEIRDLMNRQPSRAMVHLPGGIQVQKTRGSLVLRKTKHLIS